MTRTLLPLPTPKREIRRVGELRPGDRIAYLLRGRLWTETVTAVSVTAGFGDRYIAVRFDGREHDCHYDPRTALQVLR